MGWVAAVKVLQENSEVFPWLGRQLALPNLGKPRVTDCLLQTQASVGELAFLAGVVNFWQLDCKVIEPDFWFYVVKRDCWNCGTDFWNFGRVHCGRMFQKVGWVLAQLQAQQKGGGSENGLGALLCDWNNWQGVLL